MNEQLKEFREYRERMNEKILKADNKVIKRIFNIDTNTYMDGALPAKVKEMLGWRLLWYFAVMIVLNIIWKNATNWE